MTFEIAFFIKFNSDGYSGGRLHAFLMALALSCGGHNVEIFCNVIPSFVEEFAHYNCYENIKWVVKSDLNFSSPIKRYDFVVLVPRFERYHCYLRFVKVALKSNAKIVFLNFESESWFNALSPIKKDPSEWTESVKVCKYADIVLSSSAEGNYYAPNDYGGGILKPKFEYCYPSINSVAAKKWITTNKKRQIVYIGRWSDHHKNSQNLTEIFGSYLKGYHIAIIVGSGLIPDDFIKKMDDISNHLGFTYSILKKISENEKFKTISESTAMVFLSYFEGFGLPPVEAQYCGVPCVCFGLPVLREISGDAISYVRPGDYDSIRNELKALLDCSFDKSVELRSRIADVAEFEKYSERLDILFAKYKGLNTSIAKAVSCRIMYCIESLLSYFYELIPTKKYSNVNLSTDFLNAYVKLKWQIFSKELPRRKVAVYGTQSYCIWLNSVTKHLKELSVVAVVDDVPSDYSLKLWGNLIEKPEEFHACEVDAIVLATECFQKKYAARCRRLYGKRIRLIDLYEGLPKGPYPKGI